MKKSLFKNLRLQSYLQIINTIIPLVTTPYIARALGADRIGIFSYTHSIASYFALFTMLGTMNYGSRSIAATKNVHDREKVFNSIYTIQILSVSIATFAYIVYIAVFKNFDTISSLHLITLVGFGFNIQWYYYGREDFQSTVPCHMICRVLSVVALFVFVKSERDLIPYTIIMVGGEASSYILLWVLKCKKRDLRNFRFEFSDFGKHLKENLLLFVPLIAMSIYHSMDKTMLGLFTTYDQVGYYYNVEKIINVPLGLFSGVSAVLLPRMTILYSDNKQRFASFFNKSLSLIMMLGFAMCFGIASISREFVPVFLGEKYLNCVTLVVYFSPVLIVKAVSNSIRMQLLIPTKMESVYIKATIIGAISNLIFNALLIPQYGALGAIIATIISELITLIIEVIYVRDKINFLHMTKECFVFAIMGFVMLFSVNALGTITQNLYVQLFVEIAVGVAVYGTLSILYCFITKNVIYDYFKKGIKVRFLRHK